MVMVIVFVDDDGGEGDDGDGDDDDQQLYKLILLAEIPLSRCHPPLPPPV